MEKGRFSRGRLLACALAGALILAGALAVRQAMGSCRWCQHARRGAGILALRWRAGDRQPILALLASADPSDETHAIHALIHVGSVEARAELRDLLWDRRDVVCWCAADALASFPTLATTKALLALLERPDAAASRRVHAASSLCDIGTPVALSAVERALSDRDSAVAQGAARALAKRAVRPLLAASVWRLREQDAARRLANVQSALGSMREELLAPLRDYAQASLEQGEGAQADTLCRRIGLIAFASSREPAWSVRASLERQRGWIDQVQTVLLELWLASLVWMGLAAMPRLKAPSPTLPEATIRFYIPATITSTCGVLGAILWLVMGTVAISKVALDGGALEGVPDGDTLRALLALFVAVGFIALGFRWLRAMTASVVVTPGRVWINDWLTGTRSIDTRQLMIRVVRPWSSSRLCLGVRIAGPDECQRTTPWFFVPALHPWFGRLLAELTSAADPPGSPEPLALP